MGVVFLTKVLARGECEYLEAVLVKDECEYLKAVFVRDESGLHRQQRSDDEVLDVVEQAISSIQA
jgi:hypothetical protein